MSTKLRTGALAAPLILILGAPLAGCGSSSDGFVEEGRNEDATLEQNAVKSIMTGLGAVDPAEKPPEFKPRAPLVVPPNSTLPPPRDGKVVDPRFPRNPEEVADEQRRAAAKNDTGEGGRIMTPDELSRDAVKTDGPRVNYDPNAGRPLKPDELNGQGKANDEAIKRAANPSGRKTLIEPPDQYRQPSPNAPVAPPEEKSSWKPSWWPL